MNRIVKGFKGFDRNLKCKDQQFKIGDKIVYKGDVKLCRSGFHFCEYPLDVFGYYPPNDGRFAEVEADDVSNEKEEDSKRACKAIHIKTELTLKAMIEAAVKFTFDRVDWKKSIENKEDKKGASNSGDRGAASNFGDRGAASNSGYYGAASNSGKEGIAISIGIESKAKAMLGTWLVLSEWKFIASEWHRVDVKSVKVDGKKIKADTFYTLKKGKFVEVVQ